MAYSTISKPSLHFNTKLYTGNGNTQSITGVGFQPDLTWIKNRTNSSTEHYLYDAVRGAGKSVRSSSDIAEATETNQLTAFDSDGFSIGNWGDGNTNSSNIVSWNWKAGTTGSGTTTGAGTGKAYSYSVNTTAGFSIVKYLGNGTVNHTIPHHLGVAPKMIITKNLDSGVTWIVGHDSITWANILFLDTDASKSDDSNAFNDVAPTSTVWNVGGGNGNNSDNVNYVSYCFAEKKGYSKFGSYTGNGNSSGDGAFIYLGFKPAFFMVKNVSASGHGWYMFDNKRDVDNPTNKYLVANTTAADASFDWMDFNSNGIKVRGNSGGANNSGETYIYMAIAEEPLVANVGASIPATAR